MRKQFDECAIRHMAEIEKLSFSEIARQLDTKVSIISNFCKRKGIISTHLDKAAEKILPIDKIYQQYINKVSMFELEKVYNTPAQTLKRKLHKKYPNLKFRTHDEAVRNPLLMDFTWLENELKAKPMRRIARELDVRPNTVCSAADKFGLTSRFKAEEWGISNDLLVELYITQKLTPRQIAGLCRQQYGVVLRRLHRDGFIINKAGGQPKDSKHQKLNDKNWLCEQYITNRLSMADLSEIIGTSIGNISHHLRKHNIEIRSKSDVYKQLLGKWHGKKLEVRGVYCDSKLEAEFVNSLPDNTPIARNIELTSNDSFCYIDFKIGNEYIEVKSKDQENPSPDRRRLIKQVMISHNNNIDLKVWTGKFVDIKIDNIDKYYSTNWKLFFDNHQQCSGWLIDYGFHGVEYSIYELMSTLKHIKRVKIGEELNANYQNQEVIKLIKHFSQHYWSSTHKNYLTIAMAWEQGNHNILHRAVEELWNKKKEINIYGLISIIQHDFKDFTTPSIFKPWVAAEIYKRYLPNGGTILDPCMGWGGRLIGTVDNNISYIGVDLNDNSVKSHIRLAKFLGSRLINQPVFIYGDSSTIKLPNADIIFTSPPYNDCELYHGIDSTKTLTLPIINNIFKQATNLVILNVPIRLEQETIDCANTNRFKVAERLEMKTSSFMGRKKTHEPILVFKRELS